MVKTLSAVYENGALRPLESLPLQETSAGQSDRFRCVDDRAGAWLDYEYMASVEGVEEAEPTLEEARHVLSKVRGNLSDDIRAERDSRG